MTVYCDNTAAVAVVNSGYGQVPEIMHLLRCMHVLHQGTVPGGCLGSPHPG